MARLPPRDEFEIIARYFAPLATGFGGALGLKDDAALLSPSPGTETVVTTDIQTAGVHFLAEDVPELVGRKLLRVNLSDLAAMGARPVAYLMAIAAPLGTEAAWFERLAEGLTVDQDLFGIALIGGDLTATSGPLTMTVTALGEVKAGTALKRSSARPGDEVFVSGTIGDAALGLSVLGGGLTGLAAGFKEQLVDRFRLPSPRMTLGPALVGLAHAVIDVSDGLIADLGHICETSDCGAEITADRVPLSDASRAVVESDAGSWGTILTGGDDYELLFTADATAAEKINSLAVQTATPLTRIGVIKEEGGVGVTDAKAKGIDLGRPGYRHF